VPKDSISEEDKALFRRAVENITPPDKGEPIPNRKNPAPLVYLSSAYPNSLEAESVLSYCIPNFPKKRFFELSDGKIPIQNRLDLHGLNPDNAQQTLIDFISVATEQNQRCLLIIHGKGGGKMGNIPVLKNLVNHWLPQFPQVLAFHSAISRHGGNGAVYVLLKKF
jgi:DNA-nicking Smr family endonuclease